MDVLLTCRKENKDKHWHWLKENGAFDFIQDIVEYNQEPGIVLAPFSPCSIRIPRLNEFTLNDVINSLKVYT
tara:strand:- start:546 stop:761 length:216 start_codon:yes stop_codon:yes gene_type:complete